MSEQTHALLGGPVPPSPAATPVTHPARQVAHLPSLRNAL